jgi:hypothetical protein
VSPLRYRMQVGVLRRESPAERLGNRVIRGEVTLMMRLLRTSPGRCVLLTWHAAYVRIRALALFF